MLRGRSGLQLEEVTSPNGRTRIHRVLQAECIRCCRLARMRRADRPLERFRSGWIPAVTAMRPNRFYGKRLHFSCAIPFVCSHGASSRIPDSVHLVAGTLNFHHPLEQRWTSAVRRVVRTMFLLRYISEAELRQAIQVATNKSERFNEFVQWIAFGGDNVIARIFGMNSASLLQGQ
jgi:hypothetical protein